jgi:hypothetical protein
MFESLFPQDEYDLQYPTWYGRKMRGASLWFAAPGEMEARCVLRAPMDQGVAAGYDRLADLARPA